MPHKPEQSEGYSPQNVKRSRFEKGKSFIKGMPKKTKGYVEKVREKRDIQTEKKLTKLRMQQEKLQKRYGKQLELERTKSEIAQLKAQRRQMGFTGKLSRGLAKAITEIKARQKPIQTQRRQAKPKIVYVDKRTGKRVQRKRKSTKKKEASLDELLF
jgi:hypothetical protein